MDTKFSINHGHDILRGVYAKRSDISPKWILLAIAMLAIASMHIG